MSESESGASDVPSNPELAERMARVEEQVGHVADTVDRIDTTISEDQESLREQVEDNRKKVKPVYTAYRFGRWAAPVGATLLGGLAAMGAI